MKDIQTIYPELHRDIKHLTQEEVLQMQKDYISGELKVKLIMEKYNISGFRYSTFSKRVPSVIDKKIACPECRVYSNRKIKGRKMPLGPAFCPSCGKLLISDFDPHKRIRELNSIELMAKHNPLKVRESEIPVISVNVTSEDFHRLSFDQKIFFGSWVMSGIDENLSVINGRDLLNKKICPTQNYFDLFMNSLVQDGFLPSRELWRLRIELENVLVKEILNPSNRFEVNAELQVKLWQEIAFHEIVEYYTFKMKDVNFPVNISEKARLVIESVIKNYSVAQAWNLIYYSVQNACEFYAKNLGNRLHAANTVLYNCSRKMDRNIQNSLIIKPFRRWVKCCQQSEMSIYFFEKFLKIGDMGFTQKPSLDLIAPFQVVDDNLHKEEFFPKFE